LTNGANLWESTGQDWTGGVLSLYMYEYSYEYIVSSEQAIRDEWELFHTKTQGKNSLYKV